MTDEKTPKPETDLDRAASAFIAPAGSGLERGGVERMTPPRPRRLEDSDPPDSGEASTLAELGGELSRLRARVDGLEAELRAGLDAVGRALAKGASTGPTVAPAVVGGVLTAQSGAFSHMSDAEREEYRRGLGFIR